VFNRSPISISLGLALVLCGCLQPYPDDWDGDGFVAAKDCNDADSAVNPNAVEVCDGIDNNCDGDVDEDSASDAPTWYTDADGDGYGADASASTACTQPDGAIALGGDCDDRDANTVNDMDCDGVLSEDDCNDYDPDIFPWERDGMEGCGWTVGTGFKHTCGHKSNGSVECWGIDDDSDDESNDNHGQVSDAPEGSTFLSVSTGFKHTCGVNMDRQLECWGIEDESDDDSGQVSLMPSDSFKSVSAGYKHTCGVKTDYSVVCWGRNDEGQSDPPDLLFDSVSASGSHACGVRHSDQRVSCWGIDNGSNDWGQVTGVPPFTFLSVSAGHNHTCGVKTDNSVSCWGRDEFGLLNHPVENFESVSAGYRHTCGIRTDDGSVVCWGITNGSEDDHGQVSNTPSSGSFLSVSAGWGHTCGVKSDGSVMCWGWDVNGQSTPPTD
jgi:alpha-tubulin suppressor-like RCC1 family protein